MANLQQLIDDNQPIYVLNRTGRITGGKTKPYAMVIKTTHGRAIEIIVPATKFPFLLTGQVPASALKDAEDLFKACRRGGALEVLEPEEAMEMLQDPQAQKSIDAALARFRRKADAKPGLKAEIKSGDSSERRHISRTADADETEKVPRPVIAKQDVDPSIKQLCVDLDKDDSLAQEVLGRLTGMPEDDISKADLGHIVSAVDIERFPRIVKWARNELAKRSGAESQELTDDDERPRRRRGRPVGS
ncbi:MAG: hypothetical protein WCY09_09845 [Candidatus Omnitrophota bacterium]